MNKQDKPRVCEVLGVDEDEVWEYPDFLVKFRIHNGVRQASYTGNEWCDCASESSLLEVINHPDRIIHKPRFTEEEVEDAKAILKFFPDADMIARTAGDLSEEDSPELYAATREGRIILIENNLFSSIRPGQSIQLSEICGGEES